MKRYFHTPLLILAFLLPITIFGQILNPEFEQKLGKLYSHSVPLMRVDELAEKMMEEQVVLIDSREKEEYEVSHIKGAKFLSFNKPDMKLFDSIDKNTTVVVYCSVGYRSEKIGEKLQKLGFKHVYNLYGGIFEWKNQQQIVVNHENKPTEKVHTYNKNWGQWLQRGQKVY